MHETLSLIQGYDSRNDTIAAIIHQYGSRLFGFIKNRVHDVEDARDILQDVFFEFTESSRMEVNIDQASAWLYRVARNKIIDKYRKKKTERLDDIHVNHSSNDDEGFFLSELIESGNATPENQLDNSFLMLAIEDTLDELPKEQREVFVMHELENKSFKEISSVTGASVNTLLSRKRYAVLHLRIKLNKIYNELLID